METVTKAGPGCRIISRGTDGPSVMVFVSSQRDSGDELAGLVTELCPGKDFSLCIVPVDDWNDELSPWEADCCGSVFGGNAGKTCERLLSEVIPFIRSISPECALYAAGYSLAGLFALYALCSVPSLGGAAACSGSLWFPGWFERTTDMKLPEGSRVYLSLGGKEEKTSDPVMAQVGKAYQRQFEILKGSGIPCVYEKNPGGHFKDTSLRLAKGIAWLVKQ